MQIAFVFYPLMTALDAIGPYEVLRGLPGTTVRLVGAEIGPVPTDSGVLHLGVTHTYAETPRPDVVVVPGGPDVPTGDDVLIGWLSGVHHTTTWTASVCTGALLLGAAGVLDGLPATTHWQYQDRLREYGAQPRPEERIVHAGKVVTAAGVSAGIDLGLWLAAQIAGAPVAKAIQLGIEYDPRPPFDSGHPSKASPATKALARAGLRVTNTPLAAAMPLGAWSRTLEVYRRTRKARADGSRHRQPADQARPRPMPSPLTVAVDPA